VKCEMSKSRNRHINKGFGYQELEESRIETLHHRSPKVVKCEKHLLVQVSDTGSWSVETLHHRNTEMLECRNAKNTFWCRFQILGVGVSKHFTTRIPKCRNAEM
jgi:hypothetical protein